MRRKLACTCCNIEQDTPQERFGRKQHTRRFIKQQSKRPFSERVAFASTLQPDKDPSYRYRHHHHNLIIGKILEHDRFCPKDWKKLRDLQDDNMRRQRQKESNPKYIFKKKVKELVSEAIIIVPLMLPMAVYPILLICALSKAIWL